MARCVAALTEQPIELRRRRRQLYSRKTQPPIWRKPECRADALHVGHCRRDTQQWIRDLIARVALDRQRMAAPILFRSGLRVYIEIEDE